MCLAHRRPPLTLWLVGQLESERCRKTVPGKKHVAGGCSPLRRGDFPSTLVHSKPFGPWSSSKAGSPSHCPFQEKKKKGKELAMQGLWLSSDSSLVAPVVSTVPADTQDTPVWTVSGP